FAKMPKNTFNALLQPENKQELKTIMTYHVVRGNLTTADLKRAVVEGNGAATLRTLEGDSLVVRQAGSKLTLTDTTGHVSTVSASNSQLGNNVVHAVDRILMPGS
ncbi:MAG: fasciclin domain-containing protein, partial [Pseudomonadota bacterium]